MNTPTDMSVDEGFTLVEVLVSIAVIALMLGLLLPSLSGARESGRAVVCASNLRQLITALDLYAGDHKDRYAPGAPDFAINRLRWHGSRASASGEFEPIGGTLTSYLSPEGDSGLVASRTVRACPTFANVAAGLKAARVGFERSAGGYGYNNAYVGVQRGTELAHLGIADGSSIRNLITDQLGSPRDRFVRPSSTIGFADAAFADGNPSQGIIEYSFIEPRFWPDRPAARADPTMHFRHGAKTSQNAGPLGNATIAFLDGHVSPERRTFTWSSGFYLADPAVFNIGWSGIEDNNSAFGAR